MIPFKVDVAMLWHETLIMQYLGKRLLKLSFPLFFLDVFTTACSYLAWAMCVAVCNCVQQSAAEGTSV